MTTRAAPPPSGVEEDAHGQEHAGRSVIGGEAIVSSMRKERCDMVGDEGAWIEVESPAELDQRQSDGPTKECPDDRLPLLLARQAQPDVPGDDEAEEEGVLGADDDEGVHRGSLGRPLGHRRVLLPVFDVELLAEGLRGLLP